MHRGVLALLLVGACGRIGFDETRDAGTGVDGEVPAGEWRSVSSGQWHACGIAMDRSLWCWGDNGSYQISSTPADYMPITRIGATTTWSNVSAGQGHTCAIETSGALWCWGSDVKGQIGDGTPGGNQLTPVRVGVDSDWAEVGAGGITTCARKTTGTIWCWGSNTFGALGLGMPADTQIATPMQVGTESDWVRLRVAPDSACAIRRDGSAVCWGEGLEGHLGNGVLGMSALSPTPWTPTGTWKQIEIGDDHTCAIDSADRLWCLGRNESGQLATGDFGGGAAPTEVVGGGTWSSVAVGDRQTCGVKTDGSVWCWGDSARGQTGVVTRTLIVTPELRASAIAAVSAYGNSMCWLGVAGGIACMGDTNSGQNPASPPTDTATLVRIDTNWLEVTMGSSHACGRKATDTWCWGRGYMGDGEQGDSRVPISIGAPFTAITAGDRFTVAIAQDGTIWEWGRIAGGSTSLVPVRRDATNNWVQISAGEYHVCARNQADELWCWGSNESGQLGDGTLIDRSLAVQVPGVWTAVDAGNQHTCAVQGGKVFCWGANAFGQLGTGDSVSGSLPRPINSALMTFEEVAAAAESTCARTTSGQVFCWGNNAERQLADGTTTGRSDPAAATAHADYSDIEAGDQHYCGRRAQTLYCWGHRNELADDFDDATLIGAFTRYSGGQHSGCALDGTGDRYCWGSNGDAQYGDGTGWADSPWTIVKP